MVHWMCHQYYRSKRAKVLSWLKKRQIRANFEQSAAAIYNMNLNGEFILVNPTFCKLTGYSEEELLQMRIHDQFCQKI